MKFGIRKVFFKLIQKYICVSQTSMLIVISIKLNMQLTSQFVRTR